MQTFLLGSLGAVMVIAIFAAGAFCGWKAHMKFYQKSVEPLGMTERKQMEQEQEAFRQLQNYNSETAYGLNKKVVTDD